MGTSQEMESDIVRSVRLAAVHQRLVNRIVTRARSEGSPLTELEIQQFDTSQLTKDACLELDKRFEQEIGWQNFLDRISGLLMRIIAEDSTKDPQAAVRYDEMVHDLEDRQESFSLWACCVPAIPGYRSRSGGHLQSVTTTFVIVAIILVIVLRMLKLF